MVKIAARKLKIVRSFQTNKPTFFERFFGIGKDRLPLYEIDFEIETEITSFLTENDLVTTESGILLHINSVRQKEDKTVLTATSGPIPMPEAEDLKHRQIYFVEPEHRINYERH